MKTYETKSISDLLQSRSFEKTEARCERDELIEQFRDRLNPSRIEAGYKPLTVPMILRHVKTAKGKADTTTLRDFYKECTYANSFSKWFWYCVKK